MGDAGQSRLTEVGQGVNVGAIGGGIAGGLLLLLLLLLLFFLWRRKKSLVAGSANLKSSRLMLQLSGTVDAFDKSGFATPPLYEVKRTAQQQQCLPSQAGASEVDPLYR